MMALCPAINRGTEWLVPIPPGLVDAHVHLAFDANYDPVAALAARDDDAAVAAVRDHADRGVDLIKIMASGGNWLTPTAGRPSPTQSMPVSTASST